MIIDIGIFAYNEEASIEPLLEDLLQQTLVSAPQCDIRIFILANGCIDRTVEICNAFFLKSSRIAENQVRVLDLPFKGKSKTWNHFVHTLARKKADYFIFLDADIRLPEVNSLKQMANILAENKNINIINSKPVKDISLHQTSLRPMEKIILSAGGTSDNWKKSICGQLYISRASLLTDVHMPIGLPVEDGFLRAMLLTKLLTSAEQTEQIQGYDTIWHTYESIKTLGELIQHQTRIVIGSAINSALFHFIGTNGGSHNENAKLLKEASENDLWLSETLQKSLPRAPFGYVPFHFVTKRFSNMLKQKLTIKRLVIAFAGVTFDFIIWLIASVKMMGGKGSGYW